MSARQLALHTISRCLQGRDLQSELSSQLSCSKLDLRDKGLATKLCYDYLRQKIRLEFILSTLIKRKFKKLPKIALQAMGLAAYELLFLEKVPDYASVNWYVSYIRKHCSNSLGGLANAVLRRIAEEKERFLNPNFYRTDQPRKEVFWSRYYACPLWIVELVSKSLEDHDCKEFLCSSLLSPGLGIRINALSAEKENILAKIRKNCSIIEHKGYSLQIDDYLDHEELIQWEQAGLLSRQSYEAQSILYALSPMQWEEPVWDICAGIGGKTGMLKELGLNQVYASDLNFERLKHCKENLDRLGHGPGLVFLTDARKNFPCKVPPKSLLMDVPCSGLGVLSRRPDIKHKLQATDLEKLLDIQRQLLENCLLNLLPGARLIYLTCTVNFQENQEQMERVLKKHQEKVALKKMVNTSVNSEKKEFFFAALFKKLNN